MKKKDLDVMFSSEKQDWATPQKFFDEINRRFHFTLDACADETNHKCEKYFTEEQNGLKQDWGKNVVFCTPPYNKIVEWVKKCYHESRKGATVVMLIPNRTETRYWEDWIFGIARIEFIPGRLKFGGSKNSAPFGSALVIYYPQGHPDSLEEIEEEDDSLDEELLLFSE
jgi:phage N-6-adenine-methyltransferase